MSRRQDNFELQVDLPVTAVTLFYQKEKITLPEAITSASTIGELLGFLETNPQHYAAVRKDLEQYHLSHHFQQMDALVRDEKGEVKLFLCNKQNRGLIDEKNPGAIIGCYEIILAPMLRSKILPKAEALILPPPRWWFDITKVTIKMVCQTYLGKSLQNYTLGRNLDDPSIYQFIHLCRFHRSDPFLQEIATALVYYCIDTHQQQLLREHPSIAKYAQVPISPGTIYEEKLSSQATSSRTSIDSIMGLVRGAHSNAQRFSFLRSKQHDPLLESTERVLCGLHNEKRASRSTIGNVLLTRIFHHRI